jgi:hypothetical protein
MPSGSKRSKRHNKKASNETGRQGLGQNHCPDHAKPFGEHAAGEFPGRPSDEGQGQGGSNCGRMGSFLRKKQRHKGKKTSPGGIVEDADRGQADEPGAMPSRFVPGIGFASAGGGCPEFLSGEKAGISQSDAAPAWMPASPKTNVAVRQSASQIMNAAAEGKSTFAASPAKL